MDITHNQLGNWLCKLRLTGILTPILACFQPKTDADIRRIQEPQLLPVAVHHRPDLAIGVSPGSRQVTKLAAPRVPDSVKHYGDTAASPVDTLPVLGGSTVVYRICQVILGGHIAQPLRALGVVP